MSSFSIVRQDQFIQATRDSGYKGTDSALSEIIDNAIQAKANKIAIRMNGEEQEYSGRGPRPQPRVTEVVIADNGRGMNAETLRKALRFGDGSRFNDRTDLGRFGMGLPNSSVSQCVRFEVYTWQRDSKTLYTYVDVGEVASGQMEEIPQPVEKEIPEAYKDLAESKSGTLVIWNGCDRLDHGQKLETLDRALRHSLGRMFRYYLIGDFKLTLNDQAIGPFDPLYMMPEAKMKGEPSATQHGDEIKYEVPIPSQQGQTSTVVVKFSLLPAIWQEKYGGNQKDAKKERNKRFIDSSAGFSIVRHGREIDLIKSPYHAKHWTDAWYRVEIRFEPELDEVFGVTHTKQHARITSGSPLYEKLKPEITANVSTMKDMIVSRGKKSHKTKRTDRAEQAAKSVQPRLKPIIELQAKSEFEVQSEVKDYVEQQQQFNELDSKEVAELQTRLAEYEVLFEFESLPGAPFYRTKIVGRSIIVLLNTDHPFYNRVFMRLENESPIAKTGVELLLMTLARSEVMASDEGREWYQEQRQEWSQQLKVFMSQVEELDPADMDEELVM
jgi:hypothetical protein